jgi:ribosome biogenesis GTPase
MPKYRGDSEDWLDHEGAHRHGDGGSGRGRAGGSKQKGDKAKPLPSEQANATVAEVFPNQCRVRLDEDRSEILCSYRRATVFQQGDVRERSPVAVGDRVLAQRLNPQSGIVEGVCLRRNHLSRPAPGKEDQGRTQHVVAANVDILVIMTSATTPAFSPGLVDRYLVAATYAGIEPILCLNKVDQLAPDAPRPSKVYRELGYSVFEISTKQRLGIEPLLESIRGKSAAFCGQSGVGKTSLLRVLLGSEVGKVGDVSDATGKGKHTTSAAILLRGAPGSDWIDTPGVREFGLAEIQPEQLKDLFPEFRNLSCQAPGCLHESEEGCAARTLGRYPSYRRMMESLRSGEG